MDMKSCWCDDLLIYCPDNWSSIYLGDLDGSNEIISIMKSKNGSTIPSNGLLTFIDKIRNP